MNQPNRKDVKMQMQQAEWDMFRLLPPKSDGIENGCFIFNLINIFRVLALYTFTTFKDCFLFCIIFNNIG